MRVYYIDKWARAPQNKAKLPVCIAETQISLGVAQYNPNFVVHSAKTLIITDIRKLNIDIQK